MQPLSEQTHHAKSCGPGLPPRRAERFLPAQEQVGGDVGRALRVREVDEAAEYPFSRAQLIS